jgi:hypothetical protein
MSEKGKKVREFWSSKDGDRTDVIGCGMNAEKIWGVREDTASR